MVKVEIHGLEDALIPIRLLSVSRLSLYALWLCSTHVEYKHRFQVNKSHITRYCVFL